MPYCTWYLSNVTPAMKHCDKILVQKVLNLMSQCFATGIKVCTSYVRRVCKLVLGCSTWY